MTSSPTRVDGSAIPGACAVRACGVEKSFGSGDSKVSVLRGVDMETRLGELVLLMGPSGCGKTTLISALCGTLNIDAGRIELLGRDLASFGSSERVRFRGQHVGFVFQQFNLIPTLSAMENVSIPCLMTGCSDREAEERAGHWLESVGLGSHIDSFPREMSGGQQQRVAIARALVHEPDLLICDEPTAALDTMTGRTVMELLKTVATRPNRSVIIVTHDQRIEGYADRIIEMEDGRIRASRAAHLASVAGGTSISGPPT